MKSKLYIVTRLAPPTNDDNLFAQFGEYPSGRECGVVASCRLGSAKTDVIVCLGVKPKIVPTFEEVEGHPLTGVLAITALGQAVKERWLKKIKKLNVVGIYTPSAGETLKGVLDRAEAELTRRGKTSQTKGGA